MKSTYCRVPAPAFVFTALLFVLCAASSHAGPPFPEFIDPNPNAGNQFGATVLPLSSGNVVITSPFDDAGGTDAGAVTWGSSTSGTSGTSGVSGAVTSNNSLVVTADQDRVGDLGVAAAFKIHGNFGLKSVTALNNGNYVVNSRYWDNAGVEDAGAVTLDSGTSGISGISGAVTSTSTSSSGLVGLASNAGLASVIVNDVNSTYIARFLAEGSGRVRLGSLKAAVLKIATSGTGQINLIAAQILAFTAPLKLYLAESPFTLNASASSGLSVTYKVISGPARVSGNVLTLTGTGMVKVSAIQAGNSGYLPATSLDRTITVSASPTTLTLTNLSQTYTSKPRPITVLGTTVAVVSYKVGLTYGSTAPTNVGSYPVKAVVGDIIKTGTLLITKAPLFVTPDDQRKLAGQVNPALKFFYGGFLGSDKEGNSVSKAPVIATRATANSPGGLYPITASLGTTANYIFVYLSGTMKVESFAGNYEALLVDANSTPVGKLSITVSLTGKTFTAKLATATETSAVSFVSSNLITVGEQATGTATTLVGTGKIPYRIDFTLPTSGNVTASAKSSNMLLGSAADGRKLSTATVAYAGAHTAVLEPATPTGSTVPAGAGWATASISTTGVITLTGKLGDGTGFTSALSPDDLSNPGYRLFVQPYITARTQSFLAGSFTLTEHPTIAGRRYLAQSNLTWKKTKLDTDVSYSTTFGPVNTVLMIDPWLKPKTTVPTFTLAQRLGLTGTSFGVTHSDTGSASQPDLPTRLSLSTTNAVSVLTPSANLTKWKTLTFVPKTGTFTGSFELSDAIKRPVTFSGILRQPATLPDTLIGEGHYLLPPLVGTEKTTGEVMFTRP